MPFETAMALLRHALTAGGGILVTAGLTTADGVDIAAGSVVALIGFGWSVWRKYSRQVRTGSAS